MTATINPGQSTSWLQQLLLYKWPVTNVNHFPMVSPDTLYQVINQLRQQGYTNDLNQHEDNPLWLDPDAYIIDNVYRFEGLTTQTTSLFCTLLRHQRMEPKAYWSMATGFLPMGSRLPSK